MPNTASAKKRVRVTARRTIVNRARVSRVRTFVKKCELAILAGDATAAKLAFAAMEPEVSRGVTKGILHKNTAARKISRLSKKVKSLSVQPA